MWSAGVEVIGLAARQRGVHLSSEWLAAIVPVAVTAGTFFCRAFTARDRLRRKYAEDVAKARDRVRAALVLPALATILVTVHPLIDWPREGLGALLRRGEPDDPENEVRRRLQIGHVFVEPLADLGGHFGVVRDAEVVQQRLLGVERRQGWAAGLFLLAWSYLSFWVSETGVALPRAVTAVSSLVLAGSFGWFLSERLVSVREAEAFAALTAKTDRLRLDEGAAE